MQIYAEKIFKTPIETIEIFEPKNVTSALDRIEVLKSKGLYLVGYMRYDLNTASNLPLIYFEAFDSFEPFVQKIPDKKIGTIIKHMATADSTSPSGRNTRALDLSLTLPIRNLENA